MGGEDKHEEAEQDDKDGANLVLSKEERLCTLTDVVVNDLEVLEFLAILAAQRRSLIVATAKVHRSDLLEEVPCEKDANDPRRDDERRLDHSGGCRRGFWRKERRGRTFLFWPIKN